MKKLLLLILVAAGLSFSSGYGCRSAKAQLADTLFTKLKADKQRDEEYYITHGDDLISLVKVGGADTLLEIKDTLFQKKYNRNKWPDKYDYSFDILKGDNHKIIYIDRISSNKNPYTLHIYTHYFDSKGYTYAFEKKEAMFFDGAKPKLVMDNHVTYYDKDFRIIGETDTVKDSNQRVVQLTQQERNKMDFKYDVYKNLNSCVKGYNIKLKN